MIKLLYPCKYIGITQGYSSSHKAIDLGWDSKYGGPNHTLISPADGTVAYVVSNYKTTEKTLKTYGNYIIIDHGNNVRTLVAHLKYNTIKVKKGQKVKQGQVLGNMGNTGYSKGTHCHFEVIINNSKVNPLNYSYIDKTYTVGSNTSRNYKILKIEEKVVDKVVDKEIPKEENIDEKECNKEEKLNIIFEKKIQKTAIYKIKLNEKETLLIVK